MQTLNALFGPPAPTDFVLVLHIAEVPSSLLASTDFLSCHICFLLSGHCHAETKCCLMLFVLSLGGCLGHIISCQRQREVETTVFSFYCLPNLADRKTSCSAAGFSLETRSILPRKTAWVINRSRGSRAKYWRNKKKKRMPMDILFTLPFVLVFRTSKRADTFWERL